jgi:cell division septation protein DedD
MKIKEILELTQTKKLADITKEDLSIGEKPAREALKSAGCYSISGKRGWYFDGDKDVLERSIYDFAPPTRRKGKPIISAEQEVSATLEKPKAVKKPSSQQISKQDKKQVTQESNKPVMKKVTYEIEEQLHDQLRIKAIIEKRTVSEIVNEIIKGGINKYSSK